MSFSKDVKKELAENITHARHCKIAEIAGMICTGARIIVDENNENCIEFSTESQMIARKYFTYVQKTFNIELLFTIHDGFGKSSKKSYIIRTSTSEQVNIILQALKAKIENNLVVCGGLIYQQSCCKRAFLRGAYLIVGAMSDPNKAYYFEYALENQELAIIFQKILATFSIDGKIVKRKSSYILYIKESSQIVDVLNILEAHVALMNFENVRIVKEMRNDINRRVNCETYNIGKTVAAATKQIEDILFIKENLGFDKLNGGLRDIALIRLEYPESSLVELGEKLIPPVGKSGVNHRLKKLSQMADSLRATKEENYVKY